MNRADIRQAVFDQVDWQPDTSEKLLSRLDRFINRAYQQLALEAPYLFFEDRVSFATQPDVKNDSAAATDLVRTEAGNDQWVLTRPRGIAGVDNWAIDGTWDGRIIEVKDPTGQWHRRIAREFWEDIPSGLLFVSLDRPWRNTIDIDMEYRITTPRYFLPADVIQVNSIRLWDPTRRSPLSLMYTETAERYSLDDIQAATNASGTPTRAFRQGQWKIQAPTRAPLAVNSGTWDASGDATGQFDYCFTYVWGKRDAEYVLSNGVDEALWESSPSPISSKITSTGSAGNAIRLTLPDIDWMLNFNNSGTARATHSGLRKRIYRRRYTATTSHTDIESPQVFELLAEVDGATTAYNDTGATLTDIQRRLKSIHGYHTVQLSPLPSARYDVDVRCVRRPQPLDNDFDAPNVHPEAMDVLLYKILSIFYEAMGDPAMSAQSQQTYQDRLWTLNNRYGSLPKRFRKRLARASDTLPKSSILIDTSGDGYGY